MPNEGGTTELQKEPEPSSAHLDSWKEIAGYLKRDPRTVRRWERLEGLPVHRHLHGKKGSVYAFAREIDTWLVGRREPDGAAQLPLGYAPQAVAFTDSATPQRAPSARPLVIAVLPLRDLTSDLEGSRFADGLTEELVLELGQCCPQRLRVIASTSAMQYKQSPKNIRDIGKELGADYIIEGNIRRVGQRVRLAARLIMARDQAHVWADSYEVQLPPIFAIQQTLARELANSLVSELEVKPSHSRPRVFAWNNEAYTRYLEGKSYFLPTDEDIKKKLESLYLAIRQDPRFARTYAEIALVNFPRLYRDDPPIMLLEIIRENALQALNLDPKLADGHVGAAAYQLFLAWNWPEAEKSSRRAIELNPSSVRAHNMRAAYHLVVGERAQAIEELDQAHQLNPRFHEHGLLTSLFTYFARDYDSAIKRCQPLVQEDPPLPVAQGLLGLCYAMKGSYPSALSSCGHVTEPGGGPIGKAALACAVYNLAGERDSAEHLLQELVAAQANRYVRSYYLALASAGLGNDQETLNWLEKAFEQHDPFLVFLKVDPRFEPISGHPHFRKLIRRIGLHG